MQTASVATLPRNDSWGELPGLFFLFSIPKFLDSRILAVIASESSSEAILLVQGVTSKAKQSRHIGHFKLLADSFPVRPGGALTTMQNPT